MAFIQRAAANPVARAVKIADLKENMDLSRLSSPTDRDRERLKRYEAADLRSFLDSQNISHEIWSRMGD